MQHQLAGALAQVADTSTRHAGPSHSNLYVSNLPHDATEQQVEALFQPYGDVVSTRLVRASRLGASTKTFAFVKFGTVQQALTAIRALNQTPCGGLGLLEVKFADADAGDRNPELSAPPSDNLYCKNLPGTFSDEDLRGLFAPFGELVESKLLHHGDETQGTGALVRLDSVDAARRSIAALHNTRLPGAIGPLVVRFADSAEQKAKKVARMGRAYDRWAASARGGGGGGGGGDWPGAFRQFASGSISSAGGSDFGGASGSGLLPDTHGGAFGLGMGFGVRERDSSIYIKYLPETADKLFLYEKFAPFGAVHSVKVMLDDLSGLCKGVGFVNYLEAEAALRAVRAMNGCIVGNKRLHVTVQTPREGPRGAGPQRQQQQQQPQPHAPPAARPPAPQR